MGPFTRRLISLVLLSPGPAARVGPAAAGLVLHEADLPPVDVRVVQLVNGTLHVGAGPELDHPLVGAFFVSVSIGDLAGLSHEILQKRYIPIGIILAPSCSSWQVTVSESRVRLTDASTVSRLGLIEFIN